MNARKYLLHIYFFIYNIFYWLHETVFYWIGDFRVVYCITERGDKLVKKNVTLPYYLGLSLEPGLYYARIYTSSGVRHIAYKGYIKDLKNFVADNKITFQRKNIILTCNKKSVHLDLNVLDEYRKDIIPFQDPVVNVDIILKLLGIACTDVTIITLTPFSTEFNKPHNLSIYDFYQEQ